MKQAPTYFENYTKTLLRNLEDYEWAGDLVLCGNKEFSIKYAGELFENEYIVGTDNIPSLVIATDVVTGQSITIFDETKYGYNAMLCDEYSDEERGRIAVKDYTDKYGENVFEIELVAYYSIDYDDEKEDFVDEKGIVKLIYGDEITFDDLKRNGYDYFEVIIKNRKGNISTIIANELA